MTGPREPSHPPSDPHPPFGRDRDGRVAAEDRPVRAQLIGGILVGLLLLAAGLYVSRKPPEPADTGADQAAGSAPAAASPADAGPRWVLADAAPAGAPPVSLSEARILGCHDRGTKRTPPAECDRLRPIELALSHAIEEGRACMPASMTGGTIEYVADVSFSRRKVRISLPRGGRSVRASKVVLTCAAAVRDAVRGVELDGVDHRHARYEIAITATYPGKS